MTDWEWGTFVSLFLLGGVIGGLTGGHLSSAYGRRRALLCTNFLFALGTLSITLAHSPMPLFAARLLTGIAAGMSTVVVPVYINELAPRRWAGMLGSANQMAIVVGILVSAIAGLGMATVELWRGMFALALVPNALQWVLLPMCVESPSWLAAQGLAQDNKEAIDKLYGSPISLPIDDEETRVLPDDIEESASSHGAFDASPDATSSPASSHTHQLSYAQLFASHEMRRPLIAALGLHVIQQFSGINAAIFYSTTIFTQTYSPQTAIHLTVLVSVVNLFMTIISTLLIDSLGRRTLVLTSEAMMAACAAAVFVTNTSLNDPPPALVAGLLVAFVGAFAVGLGAIPWIILPELIPPTGLTAAASLGTATNWGSAFVLALLFPVAIGAMGYTVFLLFALFLAMSFVFTWVYVPETKAGAVRI
ncbi:hypothetical protein PhCBS80983_g04055 [Powellomyces hirtus]|uniref:Major facilitator superfamily (MFS) profile domain-containing protein n=1 Tax=Powellomyces hirtus TaxID=109895 RepID=A0A507DZ68_9FUNG|nr:hypothetical protein PhCBS80983_g04055 [Powellomyces hirtus]